VGGGVLAACPLKVFRGWVEKELWRSRIKFTEFRALSFERVCLGLVERAAEK